MFEGICEAIHREMDSLEDKYSKGTQLSGQDLEHIDTMAHALKNLKTYEAMCGGGEYDTRSRRSTVRYSREYEPREEYRRY